MQPLQETLVLLLTLHPFSLVPLLLFLLFIFKWLSPNSTPKKNSPPSPPRLPIIGNLHQLGKYPYRSLQTLSKTYGDLMLLHLGSKPTIIISSAEIAFQVLKTHDLAFSGRPELSVFKRLLGNGNDIVSAPYGEHWRQLKSICVIELLSSKKVRSYRDVRKEEVDLMVGEIERLRVVNLSRMFRSLANDMICRAAFGRKYVGNYHEEGGVDFTKLLSEFIEMLGGHYIGDFVSWLGWIDRINGVDAKVNDIARAFDRFIKIIIQERLDVRDGGEVNDEEMKVRDFVDVLLQVQARNPILQKENIKGLILNIFAAGTEAIFMALEWMMSELIRNPRVMERLKKEVTIIMGNRKTVTEDDLENMNYLKAVLKETLRLHTPGPFLVPHRCTKEVELNGYNISAGTQVVVNAWSICRDLRYWEEPESFYPERFLDSPVDFKGHDFEYIPFGSGRRICPGMAFATVTVEFVMANLVHRFDWSLRGGEDREGLDVSEAPGLVMRKKKALVVVASPRI